MSVVVARIRLLAISFQRFFNTIAVLPVKVLTAFRVTLDYEKALHRIVLWSSGTDTLDFGATGNKSIKVVPVGEIWIPEIIVIELTTGATATTNKLLVTRKGGAVQSYSDAVGASTNANFVRGVDFGETNWLYPGDELLVYCNLNNAGDKAQARVQRRVLRVGDDF